VRMIETGELVGLYAATDQAWLWDMVDEVVDPGTCEYIRVLNGGIEFAGGAPVVESTEGWDGESGHSPTDQLIDRISRAKWTKIDFADEGVGGVCPPFRGGG